MAGIATAAAVVGLAGAGITLGSQIYRGIKGRKQTKEANALNPQRPNLEISEFDKQSLSLNRSLANQTRLPGQSAMEDNLGLSTSQGLEASRRAGGSGQSVLANASNIVGNQSRSLNALTIEASRQKRTAEGNYSRSLQEMGALKQHQWGVNTMIPYQNEVQKKQALEASGMANMYGAMQGAGSTISESSGLISGLGSFRKLPNQTLGGSAMSAGAQSYNGL